MRDGERATALPSAREPDGRLRPVRNVYQKWYGAHWVLVDLADKGYPVGDTDLCPIRDQVYDTWFSPRYRESYRCTKPAHAYSRRASTTLRSSTRL